MVPVDKCGILFESLTKAIVLTKAIEYLNLHSGQWEYQNIANYLGKPPVE